MHRVGGAEDNSCGQDCPLLDSRLHGNDVVDWTKEQGQQMASPPSFSLGLDPRVHTIPTTPHGCPDQVRAKRGEGLDLSQTLILSLSKGEGFDIAPAPSFDRLRRRMVPTAPNLAANQKIAYTG